MFENSLIPFSVLDFNLDQSINQDTCVYLVLKEMK